MRLTNTLKLFSMLMLMILFINMASALEFDNVKDYDPITREVKITNIFGLGADIGKARLNTPLNVRVGLGYQKVGEFEIYSYMNYKSAIKSFEFLDLNKNGEKIERDVDLKYKTYEKVLVDDYDTKCYEDKESKNQTKICKQVKVGEHYEKQVVWKNLNSYDLKEKEKITIGIFTDVQKGDYVDWIPSIYGVKVEEWASWTASLETDLVSYYELNRITGDVLDSHGSNDGTNNGATRGVTGKINDAFDFDGNDDYVYRDEIDMGNDVSFCAWVNPDSIDIKYIMTNGQKNGADYSSWRFYTTPDGEIIVSTDVSTDSTSNYETGTGEISTGSWQYICFTRASGSEPKVYVDGSEVSGSTSDDWSGTIDYDGDNFNLGALDNGGTIENFWDGKIDEVGIWSRALSSSEVSDLYNNGDGLAYLESGDNPPNVILNSPTTNATYTTLQNITFNFTAYDDIELSDVQLYVNGALNQTNASGINNTNYLFDLNLGDGEHLIYGKATDNNSAETTTETINITIDTTPFIEFSNLTLTNATNQTLDWIFVEVNLTETYFENVTFRLFNSTGYEYNATYTDATRSHNFTSLQDDQYKLNATVWTTTGQINSTETRDFEIDGTAPEINETGLDNQTTFSLLSNITWILNATDNHLDKCYYNTSANSTYTIVTCNSSINTSLSADNSYAFQYCANDTFGNENCNEKTIELFYIQETQTDIDPVAEGFYQNMTLIINLTDIPTTTANVQINGSFYDPTVTLARADSYVFGYDFIVPETWGSTTGNTLNWSWNYTIDGVITNQTTNTSNFTVYELGIDDCSSYGEVILDFDLLDEETSVPFNESSNDTANVEIDLVLISNTNSSVNLIYNKTWTDENNPQVCIPSGVLNNSEYDITFTLGLRMTDHVWEFYYLDKGTLNSSKQFNSETDYTINLMDLLTADSTSFLFNYFDADGLAVTDAIVHVFRKYIGEGIFKEVERAKSDQNGDTIVHLVEEDVIYYFKISQYGEILYTTSTYTALCQEIPCTIQIEASGDGKDFPTDWDLIDDGAYTVTSDASTREVSMDYTLTDTGTMNLTTYKYNSDGSYTVLNTSSDTGTSGTLTQRIPQSAGNTTFFISVHKDKVFINSEWVDFEEKAQDRFGVTLSLFLAVLIILTLSLMAVNEGIGTIVAVIFGVALSGFLGLINTDLNTGISVVVYLILAGGILIWKLTGGRK